MWCSTNSSVSECRWARATSRSASSPTSVWVSPVAGSSSISSRGRPTSARASSTRFRVPNGSPAAGWKATSASDSSSSASHAVRASEASSRPDPHRSAARSAPILERWWAPTITFCITVMPGHSARFWKVRPMPKPLMAWAGRASRSAPSNATAPSWASYTRLTTLNKVVLPAPLGPISPQMLPSSTVNDSSRRAVTPPKRTVTPATSNKAITPPTLLRPADSAGKPHPRSNWRWPRSRSPGRRRSSPRCAPPSGSQVRRARPVGEVCPDDPPGACEPRQG